MNVGIVSNTPPFSSMHVQHIEGGFVCVVPPGTPMVARESGDVATAVHRFLGQPDPSDLSSASQVKLEVEYVWPEATVMQGSVFNISKVTRIKTGKLVHHGGFMLTYHKAAQGTQVQIAAFNRATVMDQLRQWITTPLPKEAAVAAVAEPTNALLTLVGMRINPDMDENGDTVFVMQVSHASQVEDFAGPCSFVARSEDPHMSIGVADEEVVGYLADELGSDLRGEFAVRVHEQYLEFGPRVYEDDDPDHDCFG